MNDDVVLACADLAARAGAAGFEIGYMHDNVPVEDAGWFAQATYQGARIITDEHRSPTGAALALAERILTGAQCKCGQPVTLTDAAAGCRWRLSGRRWEPGCTAPPLRVTGRPGDLAAVNRAARRAWGRPGG